MKRFILALFLSLLIIGTAWGITNIGMPKFQAFDSNGVPLSGGLLYSYDPGSSVSKQTYSDYLGTVGNTNPVVLDSRGEATIYLDGAYKLVLKDSDQTTLWTIDNYQGGSAQYISTSGSSGYIVLGGPSGTSSFTLVPTLSGNSLTGADIEKYSSILIAAPDNLDDPLSQPFWRNPTKNNILITGVTFRASESGTSLTVYSGVTPDNMSSYSGTSECWTGASLFTVSGISSYTFYSTGVTVLGPKTPLILEFGGGSTANWIEMEIEYTIESGSPW